MRSLGPSAQFLAHVAIILVISFSSLVGSAEASGVGLQGIKQEISSVLNIVKKVVPIVNQVKKRLDPKGRPTPIKLKMILKDTDDMLDSVNDALQKVRAHQINATLVPPPPIVLNAPLPDLRAQIIRSQTVIAQAVSQAETIKMNEQSLEALRRSVATIQDGVRVLAENLNVILLAANENINLINLNVDIPDALALLDSAIGEKIRLISTERITRVNTWLTKSAEVQAAIHEEERQTKKSIEENRQKFEKLKNMQVQVNAAQQRTEWARDDEIQAAESLQAAEDRIATAQSELREAQQKKNTAKNLYNLLKHNVNEGLYRCPNDNPPERCTHEEKIPWNNRYYDAVYRFPDAQARLNDANTALESARRELDEAKATISRRKAEAETAERAMVSAREEERALRARLQPLIDEILTLMFAKGSNDTLKAITASRSAVTALQARLQRLAQ